MTRILGIETATEVCSVALMEDRKLVGAREIYIPRSHASRLAVIIDDVLNKSGVEAKALDAIAVSKGPGSYTGLRIGVSTAKGMAYALEKPLIAINTLHSLTKRAMYSYPGFNFYVPMLDARRMEVYAAVSDDRMNFVEDTKATVLDEASYRSFLNRGRVLFFGDGSRKASMMIKHPNAAFQPSVVPGALETTTMAFDSWASKEFEDLEKFEPFYLKDFVASLPKAG
jgi:tRNA threonylcarbamoyladenosine biosynthesis protein TsaB